MELEYQIIPIILAGGVDTKTDPKSVNLSKLLTLENGVFDSPDRILKRYGYTNLGNAKTPSGNLTLSANIAANANALIQYADNQVYAYVPARSAFAPAGSSYPLTCRNLVLRNSFNTNRIPDYAIVNGYEIFSYFDSSLGPNYSVRDLNTGALLYESQLSNFNHLAPKLISWGNYAYLFKAPQVQAGTLTISQIDPTLASPTVQTVTAGNVSNVASLPATRPDYYTFFDATLATSGLVTAFFSAPAGTRITVSTYDQSLNVLHTATLALTFSGTPTWLGCISVKENPTTGELYVVFSADNLLYYFVLSSTLTTVLGQTLIYTDSSFSAAGQFANNTSYPTGANQMTLLAQAAPNIMPGPSSTDDQLDKIYKFNLSNAGVTFTDATFCRQGTLGSKLFAYNGHYYVVEGYRSAIQATYYLNEVSLTGVADVNTLGMAARFLIGEAAGPLGAQTVAILPEVTISGTTALVALIVQSSLGIRTQFPIYATTKETFNFLDPANVSIATVPDGNILTSNAQVGVFDGYNAEQNFNKFPEIPTLTDIGAGNLSAGTYQVVVVYEWTDRLGQIHRSTPSIPASIVLSASQAISVTMDNTVNTTKQTPIAMSVYRTIANGTVFYRVNNTNLLFRVANSGSNVFTDNVSDAQIQSHEILYTDGGILPNDPAPSCGFQWQYKNRVMLGGQDDGNQIFYSKTHIPGEPIKFNFDFYINVDTAGGDTLAGGSMDDKCILFKKSKIFYFFGDGPTDSGAGGTFSVPQEIPSPVGCAYPKSVVTTPAGLMFKSEKGIYLLDRGLGTTYIGAGVEAYNSANVTAAVHIQSKNQVRFTLDSGICLVYDYYMGQWSIFTNIAAVGACLSNGIFSYINSNGTLHEESTGYADDTSAIILKIGIPWIKMSSLQGFQRAKQLMLLGDYKSSHTLTVQVGFDYQDAYSETHLWQPDSVLGQNGEDFVDQFRIFLGTQKCEAVRVLIYDNFPGAVGEGYSLSEVSALIGIKKGMNKLSYRKTVV